MQPGALAGAWATILPAAQLERLPAGMAQTDKASRPISRLASSAALPAGLAVVAWSVTVVTAAKVGGQEAVGPEEVQRLTLWVTQALAAMVPTGPQKSLPCSEVLDEYESVCDSDVGD